MKNLPLQVELVAEISDPSISYAVRIRFRISVRLNIRSSTHYFDISGRSVLLRARGDEALISDSDWLVMISRGFETEDLAARFALRLKKAVEVSSLIRRLGVDVGTDIAVGGMSAYLREQMRQIGLVYRNDVHGIDVYPDFENLRFVSASGSMTMLVAPEPFFCEMQHTFEFIGSESQSTNDIVLLLNYALMREDPVSQIVFAISAVEMLGQNEMWSESQVLMLEELAKQAESMADYAINEERIEVAAAIRRSLHKIGLRQGVIRLLKSLELEHLKKEWDIVYGLRSELVHGLAPQPGKCYHALAQRSINLCGTILLTAIERDIPGAATNIGSTYPILPKPD